MNEEKWVISILDENGKRIIAHDTQTSAQARHVVSDYIMRGYNFIVVYHPVKGE